MNLSKTAATMKTPSSKADTTPDLSLPSFSDKLPDDWQELATYAQGDDDDDDEEGTHNIKKKWEQHRHQVFAETTSDTGGADRPTVAQKVPRKTFCPPTPEEEEEEEIEMVPQTPAAPTIAPPLRRGPGHGKTGQD